MFCADLSKEQLFVESLVKASRDHNSKLVMSTKKEFDRQASFFFNHVKTLDDKVNDALLFGKDVIILTEKDGVVNAVLKFRDEPFSNLNVLEKQVQKRLKVLEGIFNKKICFNYLGASPNLDKVLKDKNTVVAVSQFISNVKVNNFAIIL